MTIILSRNLGRPGNLADGESQRLEETLISFVNMAHQNPVGNKNTA